MNDFKIFTHEELISQGMTINYDDYRADLSVRVYDVPPEHPSGADTVIAKKDMQHFTYKGYFKNLVGPAIVGEKSYEYWIGNAILHRYDGFAVVYPDHEPRIYIHGNAIGSATYFNWLYDMDMDINNLTPEDKTMIDLKWK